MIPGMLYPREATPKTMEEKITAIISPGTIDTRLSFYIGERARTAFCANERQGPQNAKLEIERKLMLKK